MEINLEADDHRKFKDEVLNQLSQQNPKPTPDIAEDVENIGGWKDNYIRNLLLPKMLHFLRGRNEVELHHEEQKGGMPTQFWVRSQ